MFSLYGYLHAYFKMHSYLKILKDKGKREAIAFMRENSSQFSQYKEETYPIFNKNDPRMHLMSFTNLMGLVTLRPSTNSDALSNYQFQGFSGYIN